MAIDPPSRSYHSARPGAQRCRPSTQGLLLGAGALLVSSLLGCSKGGAPDLNSCPKLSDPVTGDDTNRALYVELRTPSGTKLVVPLDTGSGGSYSGSRMLGACEEQGAYTVEKVGLVDISGNPVATATRSGSNFNVAYRNGMMSSVAGTSFVLTTSYTAPGTPSAIALTSVGASPMMARQGDPLAVQIAVASDSCGIAESQWWLTPATMGPMGPMTTAPQVLPGGSGNITLRVPPTAAEGAYVIEGQITLKSNGRVIGIRRQTPTDKNYWLFDMGTGAPTMTTIPVATVTVTANPDVDKMAPNVVMIDANPKTPVRCGTLSLSLHLMDDKALGAGQKVKVWLGTADQPKLASTTVFGSEYLSGTFQLPLDAPSGTWYAYPDVIRDAAGNEAQATFTAGKFTLSGPGIMGMPIAAASFTLNSTTGPTMDLGVPAADLGAAPDMATPLPAVLADIKVSPTSPVMSGGTLSVSVSWTDNAHILK